MKPSPIVYGVCRFCDRYRPLEREERICTDGTKVPESCVSRIVRKINRGEMK